MSKIRFTETVEPDTPAADTAWVYLDSAGLKLKLDDGSVVECISTQLRYHGVELIGAGLSEVTIDTSSLGLSAPPTSVHVTMESDGTALLSPNVTEILADSLKVAWQAPTPTANFKLHWEVIV